MDWELICTPDSDGCAIHIQRGFERHTLGVYQNVFLCAAIFCAANQYLSSWQAAKAIRAARLVRGYPGPSIAKPSLELVA